MPRAAKESTVIAEMIRQALDLACYKLNGRALDKGEILGANTLSGDKILLRGNTNLTTYGWAICAAVGRGTWQCDLNHNRYIRGTPRQCVVSFHSMAMLETIPLEPGLYRLHASGVGYRAEAILEPETNSAEPVSG